MAAVVDIRAVHLRVDGRAYLVGADLRLAAGQTLVVAGRSGSGKSFLPRLILGMPGMETERYHLTGEVEVAGQDLSGLNGPQTQALRRRIGSVLRQGGLIENMDIRRNIALPLTYHFAEALGGDAIEARCDRVLEDLEHAHLGTPGLRPVGLDLEERLYASLARALVCEPFLLLLDDPCAGLSPGAARRLRRYLFTYEPRFDDRLPAYAGASPSATAARLVTTCDLATYLDVGDHFMLLWDGRLLDLGEAEAVRSSDDARVRELLGGGTDPGVGVGTDGPPVEAPIRG